MNVPQAVLDAVRGARSIVVATHSPMDGDGLGSGLALLRCLPGDVRFLTEAPVPRSYAFLPGFDRVEQLGDAPPPPCDLLLGLDAAEPERLGRLLAERAPGTRVLNIDHHVSNGGFGDVAWVDPAAAATGEMVFGLLRALGARIDAASALCLLTALVTDTGRFGYSSTTARTFAIASELAAAGAEPEVIHRSLFASVPLGVLRLHARATEDLRLHARGQVATLTIPHDYGLRVGATREEDVKDLVDLAVSIKGVVVGALIRGLEDGSTKVSLRSKDDRANVALVAKRWGGGGHVRAAGFSIAEGPDSATKRILDDLVAAAVAAAG
jgi:phosphoesterase RecJ-like protein